jgi:hypothetical protein
MRFQSLTRVILVRMGQISARLALVKKRSKLKLSAIPSTVLSAHATSSRFGFAHFRALDMGQHAAP